MENETSKVAQAEVELASVKSNNNQNNSQEESKGKNEIENIYVELKSLVFTIQQPDMELSDEINSIYKNAYLKILRSEIPTTNYEGNKEYFRELYGVDSEFDEIDERYSFYYNDLDGDGLPELGIRSTGYTYILKYEPTLSEFSVFFSGPTMYYTIMGVRQIGYHDGLHAGVIRDRFIIFNEENEWEIVLDLEQGTEKIPFYQVGTNEYNKIDVGEDIWNEITPPFFKAMDTPLLFESLDDIFGESL